MSLLRSTLFCLSVCLVDKNKRQRVNVVVSCVGDRRDGDPSRLHRHLPPRLPPRDAAIPFAEAYTQAVSAAVAVAA